MKLALIPPISLISDVGRCDMQLMLPHLITESSYHKVYKALCKNEDQYVILDNGAAEAVQGTDDQLVHLIRMYRPDEFTLPDTLGDGKKTLFQAEQFFVHHEEFQEVYGRTRRTTKLGMVAQGKTVEEAFETVSIMYNSWWGDYVDVIYLPRLLIAATGSPIARGELARRLFNTYGDEFEYHLFGAAPTFHAEILLLSEYQYIRSMDTSLPYYLAYHNIPVSASPDQQPVTRPKYYFHLEKEKFGNYQAYVDTFLGWAEGRMYGSPSS